MTTTLHPHWEPTEPEPVPTPTNNVVIPALRAARTQQQAAVRKTVSRKPAAVIGIVAALMVGFAFSQDLSVLLPAQVATGTEIHITPEGPIPSVVTVAPGESITWYNDDAIPHIIVAENLPTDTEDTLKTNSIFEGESQEITIAADAKPGTYLYISQTSELVAGQIIVEAISGTMSSSSSSEMAMSSIAAPVFGDNTSDDSFILNEAAQASSISSSASSQVFSAPVAVTPLPINPHVVGAVMHNAPTSANWSMAAQRSVPAVVAHRPAATAESGPALWFVFAGSLAGIWFVSRRSFKRVAFMEAL